MDIWLDSIDLEAISIAIETGLLRGITTNPSILSKSKNVPDTLRYLLELQKGPVAVQVTGQTAEEMIEDGLAIAAFSKRIVVKVPMNRQGLVAIHTLCEKGVTVLGTGIFGPEQALLAINLGVAYISPYFSHMGEEKEALQALEDILSIVDRSQTKLLAASIKEVKHFAYCAAIGVDAVTIKEPLFYNLIADHKRWNPVAQKFSSEWIEGQGSYSIRDLLGSHSFCKSC